MTKTQIRKHIVTAIAPLCEAHGYQRMPKRLLYYKIRDGVMSFVLFDGKIAEFDSGIYVMPLYMPNQTPALDYGNQIWRMDICNASRYTLNCDLSEEELVSHLANIKAYLQDTGFALLEHFGTPQGVTESISKKVRPANFFFTNAKNLHVAATFSYFYCGNVKKGQRCYKELLAILRDPAYGSLPAAEQQALEQLVGDPSGAEAILRQIQKETTSALGLPETD